MTEFLNIGNIVLNLFLFFLQVLVTVWNWWTLIYDLTAFFLLLWSVYHVTRFMKGFLSDAVVFLRWVMAGGVVIMSSIVDIGFIMVIIELFKFILVDVWMAVVAFNARVDVLSLNAFAAFLVVWFYMVCLIYVKMSRLFICHSLSLLLHLFKLWNSFM